MKTRNPKTIARGDVIRSHRFEFAKTASLSDAKPGDLIEVGLKAPYECISYETEMVTHKGKKYPVEVEADLRKFDRSDATRKSALFVVEHAALDRTSDPEEYRHSMLPHDDYPPGMYVKARRLYKNGKYNPKGELIAFHMSGFYSDMIEEVELVKRMVLN